MELSFDAEKFIALIRARDTIWNYKKYSVNDKETRRCDWLEICKEMVPDFEDKSSPAQMIIVNSFQKQWKVLRDGFLRSLKNVKRKGGWAKPYIYHNDLMFLTDLYDKDIEEEASEQKRDDSSDTTSEPEAASVASRDEVPIVRRRAKRVAQRRAFKTKEIIVEKNPLSPTPEISLIDKIANLIENEERAKQNIDNDWDKLFLLSLLQDFKKIPDVHKLDAKFDIINVLKHYRDISQSNKPYAFKRSKISTAESTTASTSKVTEVFHVKSEDDEFEEE